MVAIFPYPTWASQGQRNCASYGASDSPFQVKIDYFRNFGPMESGSIGFLQTTFADTPLDIMHKSFERDCYLIVRIMASRQYAAQREQIAKRNGGQRMYSQRGFTEVSQWI